MSSPNSNNDDQIRRVQLQMQFQSTRREDFQTVETYVEKLKSIANSLAEMDSQISDSEMVLQLLAGLPHQYNPLRNTITSTCPLPNFDEACSLLYMQEDILLPEQSTSDPDVGDSIKDKLYTVMDKVADVVGGLNNIWVAAGLVGPVIGAVSTPVIGAIGTVSASRMIAVGAVAGITAMTGWKFGKQSDASNSSS